MAEEKVGQPYTAEEILSFERIKRAMMSRVLDRMEGLWRGKQPISAEEISEVIAEEWQKVKETVYSSPAARESFRKNLERSISEEIDEIIKRDKAELECLGVVERSL